MGDEEVEHSRQPNLTCSVETPYDLSPAEIISASPQLFQCTDTHQASYRWKEIDPSTRWLFVDRVNE
jgi:hypothetical protein